ncbi:hypothetical protein [Curtobacterium sp. L1-20]|uniref:hypothetical protein n=1 Tax=Curtobacterium sp. L1-20 TaxID=3138181 RepID=UPI003B52CFF8
MDDSWVPIGANPLPKSPPLVPGVPEWLRPEVGQFLARSARRRPHWLVEYRLTRRNTVDYDELFEHVDTVDIVKALGEDESLNLVDFVLRFGDPQRQHVEELAHWLQIGGSMWRVGQRFGHPGLEQRVPTSLQNIADAAMDAPGGAGDLLADAWAAAFGVQPDPEVAYMKTVKAVEAAAVPLIYSDYKLATLGKVIKRLEDRKEWTLGFRLEGAGVDSGEMLLAMMRTIWRGHADRHGGQADYQPSSQSDAESAVLLATVLIQLITSGKVIQRDSRDSDRP